ncbi:MAG: FAD binding domain-containing protein [Thermaerobacter sp.]|nr:FAD binding domain-containing protein [Thermaerobacter sp.]
MKPAAFDYVRADTIDEVVSVLAQNPGEARILAGGQSLIPLLNMRLAAPTVLIDINRLRQLATLAEEPGASLATGCLVTQRSLEHYARAHPAWALLAAGLAHLGHPQTRNAGTVGGSLAHADPAAELPLLLTILGGVLEAQGPSGTRLIPSQEFFRFMYTTALAPDELLLAVHWNRPPSASGFGFHEVSGRHGDFALVAAAALVTLDGSGRIDEARLAVAGPGPTPLLVNEARMLHKTSGTPQDFAGLAEIVVEGLVPLDSLEAKAEFRAQLTRVLIIRSLTDAWQMAQQKAEGEIRHD